MDANLLNGLSLAYIGDCVFELYIRKHHISLGLTKVFDLHKSVIKYTCAEHQSKTIKYLIDNNLLSEEELCIYKRGRNSNANKTRKTLSKQDYINATGFEALIGYLHLLNKEDRVIEIIKLSIDLML